MQFPLSGLNTVFFALASGLYKTQQFQKNAYQNDKHLISEKPQGCLWSHLTHTLTRCPIGSLHLDNPQVYPGKPHSMHLEDVPMPKVTERTYVVATVRRPGHSIYDQIDLQDMTTDNVYYERGINLRHGYLTEYYVEDAAYMVTLPDTLREVSVLLEPLTVAEKGLNHAYEIHMRYLCNAKERDHESRANCRLCFTVRLSLSRAGQPGGFR